MIPIGISDFLSLTVFVYFHWHTISTRSIVFFSKPSSVGYSLLFSYFVRILCSQSQYNFLPLLSITFTRPQFSVYHFASLGRRPLSIAHFTANIFNALYYLLNFVPALVPHPVNKCLTVSQS